MVRAILDKAVESTGAPSRRAIVGPLMLLLIGLALATFSLLN